VTPRKKAAAEAKKTEAVVTHAKHVRISKQAGAAVGKATEGFVRGFLHRQVRYITAASVMLSSFLLDIPEVWLAVGDVFIALDWTIDGTPKWLPWMIRAIAVIIGGAHKLRKDT
jgi:hypothetical protein